MKEITKFLSIATLGMLVIYDIIALIWGGVDATISRVILGASTQYPAIPFAGGFVCGHLFWPQRKVLQ